MDPQRREHNPARPPCRHLHHRVQPINHYYFRSVTEATTGEPQLVLDVITEDDSWEQKYAPGSLKSKRLALYQAMTGFPWYY